MCNLFPNAFGALFIAWRLRMEALPWLLLVGLLDVGKAICGLILCTLWLGNFWGMLVFFAWPYLAWVLGAGKVYSSLTFGILWLVYFGVVLMVVPSWAIFAKMAVNRYWVSSSVFYVFAKLDYRVVDVLSGYLADSVTTGSNSIAMVTPQSESNSWNCSMLKLVHQMGTKSLVAHLYDQYHLLVEDERYPHIFHVDKGETNNATEEASSNVLAQKSGGDNVLEREGYAVAVGSALELVDLEGRGNDAFNFCGQNFGLGLPRYTFLSSGKF
ncbi:hypothetical protein MA16_Dca008212 [Dendrobium catenatum]|uniref:Uncharacterized protein n=1 Tax=Dendrobium catenatum TaxID=906689 RepID=A0A2I0X6I7_9ASPA|nr:hypothetical protein MA16_Dca008212 [Dendrobium catenatum]